ncbi:MAG: M28 family peptidase [bacterium]
MIELSENIIKNHVIRNTYQEKTNFINLISENYNTTIQENKKTKSRNIIIGDVTTAKVIYTAHYDTPNVLPIKSIITPQNIPFFIISQLLIGLIFCIPVFIINYFANLFLEDATFVLLISFLSLFLLTFLLKNGPKNKNNFNDNTSGVVTLIELMNKLSDEEKSNCAFIFFDNEEKGLYGSSYFRKQYKDILNNFLIVNFDCVGDGNNILLVYNKNGRLKYKEDVNKNFASNNEFNFIKETKLQLYPSDQMGFKNSVAVCALNKSKIVGYYVTNIHSKKDTTLIKENIEYLAANFAEYQKEVGN